MEDKIKSFVPEIIVDDGRVKVPVRNRHGDEVGLFYFQPTDVGMVERFNEVADKVNEITAPLEHVSIKPDGTPEGDNPADIATINEAKQRLYDLCDYLFGGNMSEAFFGQVHPFSPVGGMFYFERALESVGKFIAAQFDQETRRVSKRMGQYTQGYGGKPNRAQRRHNNRRR